MKLAKRLGYKLIIVLCIIATFCSFIASTPVHASKVNTKDFYYSGTSKGSYTVSKGLIETIIESLGAILDYLLGLMTMGFRMVFVGWTALFERCLTLIIQGLSGDEVEVDGVSATGLFSADGWITLDAIFFNHVPLLDINFFRFETIEGYDNLGFELEQAEGEPVQGTENPQNTPMIIYTEEVENENGEVGTVQVSVVQGRTNNLRIDSPEEEEDKSLIIVFKELIAGWYYTIRLISIMVMLIFLIYIGIQMAIKSTATDKAVYKKMLADWLVGMILIFCIHYVMLFIINFNEVLVEQISKLRTGATPLAVYEYGLEERAQEPITNDELELTLYDEVKTRAYDLKMTVGTTGMIMYMVLVYYAWKFTFIYLKRYLTVAVLVIMAPLIAATYAYNKVRSGKAQIMSRWFKEFAFIVLLQSIHALMYVTFMQTALALSLGSISSFILVLLLLNFMCKAEGLFRKIFGIGSQGGLLNDIADGPGLKDTFKAATNIMAAKEIKNIAKNYTKGVANLMTKPARMAGEAAFKQHMIKKAGEDYAEKIRKKYGKNVDVSSIENYSDYKKFMRSRKAQANEIGSMIKQLESGELNIDQMQEYVNSLEEGETITDINGNITGVVTAEYKKDLQAKVDKLKAVSNYSSEEKESWLAEYDELYNDKGQLKGLSIYLSEKWEDIFDPSVYTEAVKDKKGNIVGYKAIETERSGFRKLDSVGKRLSKKLSLKNIANISKEEKKHLEQQAELAKNAIFGFAGILTGIPLLVAEPKAGMVAMSFGLSNSSKLLSGQGRSYQRGISGYSIDRNGNYTFNRFEGASVKTIAHGAKVMAEEQVAEINRDHMNHDMEVRKSVETNHPKLAERLKKYARDNSAAIGTGVATIATFGVLGAPPLAIAAGAVAGARFTGRALKNSRMMDNAWARYQESMRVINKANRKAYEKRLEKSKVDDYDDFMDVLAERYFEVEHDEFQSDAERHAKAFESEYQAAVLAMENAVEEKNSQELLRDNGYDVPLDGEIEGHGETLKISQTAEDQLIEKALVTYALQTGTMDISRIVVDDKMDTIETILKTDLMTRGLVDQATDIKDVIQNLDSKVKDAQVKIVKDKRNETIVEDRLAGDAIISLMQEKGITDPSQISDEQAMQKFAEMYQDKAREAMQSSIQSNDVIGKLDAQRPEQTDEEVPKAFDIDMMKTRATTAIQARKASFTDMAKKSIDDSVAAQLRETIKKKQKLELDTQILEHEERIAEREASASEDASLSELYANLNGGIDSASDGSVSVQPSGSEDVIKMLEIQTQLHKDKKKMEMVEAKRTNGTKKQKTQLYSEISADREESSRLATPSDGARRVDTTADGSRQVGGQTDRTSQMPKEVIDIIKNIRR